MWFCVAKHVKFTCIHINHNQTQPKSQNIILMRCEEFKPLQSQNDRWQWASSSAWMMTRSHVTDFRSIKDDHWHRDHVITGLFYETCKRHKKYLTTLKTFEFHHFFSSTEFQLFSLSFATRWSWSKNCHSTEIQHPFKLRYDQHGMCFCWRSFMYVSCWRGVFCLVIFYVWKVTL